MKGGEWKHPGSLDPGESDRTQNVLRSKNWPWKAVGTHPALRQEGRSFGDGGGRLRGFRPVASVFLIK